MEKKDQLKTVIINYISARLKNINAHTYIYQQIKTALDTKTPIVIGKIGRYGSLCI
jgi:hypothetical protein